jgi:hypothetical protein
MKKYKNNFLNSKKNRLLLIISFLFLLILGTVYAFKFFQSSKEIKASNANLQFSTFPQYIGVRKAQTYSPTEGKFGNNLTKVIFNSEMLGKSTISETERISTVKESLLEIKSKIVGENSCSSDKSKCLVVMVFIDTLNSSASDLKRVVSAIYQASYETKVPVLVNFETISWWENRRELWDLKKNPLAYQNVEWYGDDKSKAIQIAWRNWGKQYRVAPPPNLASETFRKTQKEILDQLLPIVKKFTDKLSPEEEYLYPGIVWGGEMSIGVNAYYYPNGNSYINNPPSQDPGLCEKTGPNNQCTKWYQGVAQPDFTKSINGGLPQQGYNAALTLNLIQKGQPVTKSVISKIITNYISYLDNIAITTHGLPSNKIYAHVGGTYGGFQAMDSKDIVPSFSNVGWSMYSPDAENAASFISTNTKTENQNLPWLALEWLSFQSENNWQSILVESTKVMNNKVFVVANWEESVVKTKSDTIGNNKKLSAINNAILNNNSSCNIQPSTFLGVSNIDGAQYLKVSKPTGKYPMAVFLNGSTESKLNEGKTLSLPNLINTVVTEKDFQKYKLNVNTNSKLQLITDACGKRVTSPIYNLPTAQSLSRATKSEYPELFIGIKGNYVLFTYNLDPKLVNQSVVAAAYLNVSSSSATNSEGLLTKVNVINAEVRNKTYVHQYIGAGVYYASLIQDIVESNGSVTRTISNIQKFEIK